MSSRGKKDCPKCNTEVGARCHFCPNCKFDFSSVKKEVKKKEVEKEKKEEYIDPRINKLLDMPMYITPKRLSSKDHAERILSYGKERAKSLLFMAKIGKCWSHVNWDIVEKGLL